MSVYNRNLRASSLLYLFLYNNPKFLISIYRNLLGKIVPSPIDIFGSKGLRRCPTNVLIRQTKFITWLHQFQKQDFKISQNCDQSDIAGGLFSLFWIFNLICSKNKWKIVMKAIVMSRKTFSILFYINQRNK